MIYRLATVTDFPKLVEYINSKNYFMPMDPNLLHGTWVVAADNEKKIRGTIWFFHSGPNAFIDYWSADTGMIAARLGAVAEKLLAGAGVVYVRATIAEKQRGAQRLAGRLGMILSGETYRLVFLRIQ